MFRIGWSQAMDVIFAATGNRLIRSALGYDYSRNCRICRLLDLPRASLGVQLSLTQRVSSSIMVSFSQTHFCGFPSQVEVFNASTRQSALCLL